MARRLGNVTTSYTVLYPSTPVGVRSCLAVPPGRVLSCLPGGAVSGSNGPWGRGLRLLGGLSYFLVLSFVSSFPFVWILSSLTRLLFVCYLSRLILCPRSGHMCVASGRGIIRWARFLRCLLGSLHPCAPFLLCFFLRLWRVSLSIPLQGSCVLWPSGWPRLCREPVSGPPAPCKA